MAKSLSIVEQLRRECDQYVETVMALAAFTNFLLYEEGIRTPREGLFSSGRSFTTSAENLVSPSTKVTPDLSVSGEGMTSVLAEAKLGMSRISSHFKNNLADTIQQLVKYDDALTGWNGTSDNMKPVPHDLALLVADVDGKTIGQEIASRISANTLTLLGKLAVIRFGLQSHQGQTSPKLELASGSLSNAAKTKLLDRIVPINPEILKAVPILGKVKMYDVMPPTPLLLEFIYDCVYESQSPVELKQLRLTGENRKIISRELLRELLAKYCFPRNDERDPALPKLEWIDIGVEKFLKLKAMYYSNTDLIMIITKRGPKQKLDHFIKVCAQNMEWSEEKKKVVSTDDEKYPLFQFLESDKE